METIEESISEHGAMVSEGATESASCSVNEAGKGSTVLIATMTKLLKAQTELMAAQAQAGAAHHLPPLKPFTW